MEKTRYNSEKLLHLSMMAMHYNLVGVIVSSPFDISNDVEVLQTRMNHMTDGHI